jgi:hypothetical protein
MTGLETIARLAAQDFKTLGLEQLAYVKPVMMDGKATYVVYAADGTEIAVMANREIACAAVRQHDLEPLSVH